MSDMRSISIWLKFKRQAYNFIRHPATEIAQIVKEKIEIPEINAKSYNKCDYFSYIRSRG